MVPLAKSWLAKAIVASASLAVAVTPALGQGPSASRSPKAAVRLVPSVDAVAPGLSFDVAIAYTIADEWHTYWKNPGDSGAPPEVSWTLPDGFTVGELRFPAPYRVEIGAGSNPLVTYALDGEPVLLATVTAPGDLEPGGTVLIGAKVGTLLCHEVCISESASISFSLPVVADAGAVQPANAELFEAAAQQVPPADGKGKFVSVSASTSVGSAEIGDEFEIAVTVDIKPGHHIQSNRPYIPGLIATEAIWEPTPGVEFSPPVYPKAHERFDKALGAKLSEFAGQPVIRIPVKVSEEATGTSLRLAGIVTAQACSDRTSRCFPPETVAWSTAVELIGAPPAKARTGDSAVALASTAAAPDSSAEASDDTMGLPLMLLLAFVGGVILNVMPCVWPVLSIKVLSFVQQAHDEPKRVLRLGLLFALGILVSFWLLGVVAAAASAASGGATWGTQFSSPTFVIVMIGVLYVFGLSLFGVFEINLPGAASNSLSAASAREGYAGSFVKGMLATVLATPCTAPLLGTAVAAAFNQPASIIMLTMSMIGLGMGLPYVILAANPKWLSFLPRPGAWMDTLKQFTGFLLIGVVIWLLYLLGRLLGANGVVAMIAFMAFLGLACWMYGKIKLTWSVPARLVGTLAAVAVVLIGGWVAQAYVYSPPEETSWSASSGDGLPALPTAEDWSVKTPWIPHRQGLDKQIASQGHTVFVNYTATWCTKCFVQKQTVLETEAIRNKMRELGVVPLKADFTRKPVWLVKELKGYGQAGVPANVIIPAGKPDQPIVMPVSFSVDDLREKLDQAGPSQPAPADEGGDDPSHV